MNKQALAKSTAEEVAERKANGCITYTPAQIKKQCEVLGYRIELTGDQYTNHYNRRPYSVRHTRITEVATGLSFANVAAPTTNLEALQAMRQYGLVVSGGKIWQL